MKEEISDLGWQVQRTLRAMKDASEALNAFGNALLSPAIHDAHPSGELIDRIGVAQNELDTLYPALIEARYGTGGERP